jgi:hypothetical protein
MPSKGFFTQNPSPNSGTDSENYCWISPLTFRNTTLLLIRGQGAGQGLDGPIHFKHHDLCLVPTWNLSLFDLSRQFGWLAQRPSNWDRSRIQTKDASLPHSHWDGVAAIPRRSERSNANPIRQAPNPAKLSPWKDRQSIWRDHRRAGERAAWESRVR